MSNAALNNVPSGKGRISVASSYRDMPFQSEEMKTLLSLVNPDVETTKLQSDTKYNANQIFPDWILSDSKWKNTTSKNTDTTLSDILSTPPHQRTSEQVSTVIHWLMKVWKEANTMGFKRCGMMLQVFKYFEYPPGESIITEGEKGLTFYIIISGEAAVIKDGIGRVATKSQGESFGELALTQGNDVRTATVKAVTKVEVLHLNKVDYDIFVKDIQQVERRENFHLLRECPLFKEWARAKVERMANACNRKFFAEGASIFQQGDEPDNLYLVFEGSVRIIKNVHIVNKNRWPTGPHEWAELSKRITKPFLIQTLGRGGYFGELSIMKQMTRSTTAEAATRCTLIALDKLEFLHLLNHSKPIDMSEDLRKEAEQNNELISQQTKEMKGGPSSVAMMQGVEGAPEKKAAKKPDTRPTAHAHKFVDEFSDEKKLIYNASLEHRRHKHVAEMRMQKLAKERLERSLPPPASPSRPQSQVVKGLASPGSGGLLADLALSGGAGVGARKAPTIKSVEVEKKTVDPTLAVTTFPRHRAKMEDATQNNTAVALRKLNLLKSYDLSIRDRVNLLLCNQSPPSLPKKLEKDHRYSHQPNFDLQVTRKNRPPDFSRTHHQLTEAMIDEITVVDEQSGEYGGASTGSDAMEGTNVAATTDKIPLADLRTIWGYNSNEFGVNSNSAAAQKGMRFHPYEKPQPLPLIVKPLMFNAEYANYFHSNSQSQIPKVLNPVDALPPGIDSVWPEYESNENGDSFRNSSGYGRVMDGVSVSGGPSEIDVSENASNADGDISRISDKGGSPLYRGPSKIDPSVGMVKSPNVVQDKDLHNHHHREKHKRHKQKKKPPSAASSTDGSSNGKSSHDSSKKYKNMKFGSMVNPYQKPVYNEEEQDMNSDSESSVSDSESDENTALTRESQDDKKKTAAVVGTVASIIQRVKSERELQNLREVDSSYMASPVPIANPSKSKGPRINKADENMALQTKLLSKGKLTYQQVMGMK